MTRTDLIELIADTVARVDVERSRFDPGSGPRSRLDAVRDRLDTELRQLIRVHFADNTKQYEEAIKGVTAANTELNKTIGKFDQIEETLKNFVALVTAVDKVVTVVAPLV